MNPTAHTSGTTNPLDLIVQTGQEQEHRLQTALAEMDAAERNASHAAEEKIASSEEKLRSDALEELKEWRAKELPSIAKQEEESTHATCAALEATAKRHAPAITKKLTDTMLSAEFLSQC